MIVSEPTIDHIDEKRIETLPFTESETKNLDSERHLYENFKVNLEQTLTGSVSNKSVCKLNLDIEGDNLNSYLMDNMKILSEKTAQKIGLEGGQHWFFNIKKNITI